MVRSQATQWCGSACKRCLEQLPYAVVVFLFFAP
jgi:hypothetical protein